MRTADRFLTGETLQNDIGPKLNKIVQMVNRKVIGDGRYIAVENTENSIRIKMIKGRGGGAPGGGAAPYSGMFVVTDTTDYAPLSEEPPGAVTYQVTIAAGIAQCESRYVSVAEEVDLAITETGYITLEFDVAEEDGEITQEYENKTAEEVVEDLELYKGRCIIAGVDISEDKMSLTQLQHDIALVSIRTPEEPEA